MRLCAIIFFLLNLNNTGLAQGFGNYIADNALKVNDDLSLDTSLYSRFKDYKIIMVGEMHGTQEPAKLVESLAKLILGKEQSVSVGLEIPENEMKAFTDFSSESTLKLTEFFSKKNEYGMNGQAWYDLISYCHTESKVNLFFYDNSLGIIDRDSAMYLSIKKELKAFSESKIITLSGNIHNRMQPYKGQTTMGNYCVLDSVSFPKGSICSINHYYSAGTMLNNIGNGIELRTIKFKMSIYSDATEMNNYLVFYETDEPSRNNCIFYTRKVSYSPRIKKD